MTPAAIAEYVAKETADIIARFDMVAADLYLAKHIPPDPLTDIDALGILSALRAHYAAASQISDKVTDLMDAITLDADQHATAKAIVLHAVDLT